MSASDQPLPGRFIVKLRQSRQANLAAHEALEMLEALPDEIVEILRVHRVHPDGSMDLVGVSADALRARDGLMILADNVTAARRDYDALAALARQQPPPCRIELKLAVAKNYHAGHVVALEFPAACGEGVGQWLHRAGFSTDAPIDASARHFHRYQENVSQIILSTRMEPSRASE